MKVVHWSMHNGSGMNNVAASCVDGERKLGLDSHLANPHEETSAWDAFLDADVHVDHTHVPDSVRARAKKAHKWVYVAHGTPEHVFQGSVEAESITRHGFSDSFMLMQWSLQNADATVTFWPRHAKIYRSLCDKRTPIYVVPLGVDKDLWKPVPSQGHFRGAPAILSCENCHYIKWPLDLLIAWPWVYPKVTGNPSLHLFYLPQNLHRWFFPLINRNGAAYGSHVVGAAFTNQEALRNAYVSTDFYIGLVVKGDFNRVSLEANACGAKTISYRGNPYSDFWVDEGDQRDIAAQLVAILNGKVAPRTKSKVPSHLDTASAMKAVYESIL